MLNWRTMTVRLLGSLCLLGLGLGMAAPTHARAAEAQPACTVRYADAFLRLPGLGLRDLDLSRAHTEVSNLFGPRPVVCETGAYQRFIDGFRDYAREAMRAPVRSRDGMLRVAIATAAQGPQKVPYEEGRAAATLFRQTRSDLHATADDVGISPLMQMLLDTFERMGPPPALPPPAPPRAENAQVVRVPTAPLPTWAVISLYEIRDHLQKRDSATAQGKLEAILKWMETAP